MRLKKRHAPHIAHKVGVDIVTSKFIKNNSSLEQIAKIASNVLEDSVNSELTLDEKVKTLMKEYEEKIEIGNLDGKELFWQFKKNIAEEMNFPLRWEDRLNLLSHEILSTLLKENLISFQVSDMIIKNIICKSIIAYSKIYEIAEEIVEKKIKDVKRNRKLDLHYGSEEYEIVFDKLYTEELKKRGAI